VFSLIFTLKLERNIIIYNININRTVFTILICGKCASFSVWYLRILAWYSLRKISYGKVFCLEINQFMIALKFSNDMLANNSTVHRLVYLFPCEPATIDKRTTHIYNIYRIPHFHYIRPDFLQQPSKLNCPQHFPGNSCRQGNFG